MNNHILLIGAYERDNFGDLLFAKVCEKLFSPYQTIKGSLLGRDLTAIGGDQVVSARSYLKTQSQPPQAIIHCGGETLACTKDLAVDMDLDPSFCNQEQIKHNYHSYTTEIAQSITGTYNPFGYLHHCSDLGVDQSVPMAYLSIGGTGLDQYQTQPQFLVALKSRLQAAQYLSVRDRVTQSHLKRYLGISAQLHPDIVTLVSHTHHSEVQQAEQRLHIASLITGQPYVLFQANQASFHQFGLHELATHLSAVARKYHWKIVLQPAGLAHGQDLLAQFHELAEMITLLHPEVNVSVQSDRQLWSQVAVIAHAQCCIASSLHVRIVACSYARPCLSLPNTKVTAYTKTWQMKHWSYDVTPESFVRAVHQAVKLPTEYYTTLAQNLVHDVELGIQELRQSLKLQPSEDHATQATQADTNAVVAALSAEADALRQTLIQEVIEKRSLEHTLQTQINQLQATHTQEVQELYMKLAELEAQKNSVMSTLSSILDSTSWQVTQPLRAVTSTVSHLLQTAQAGIFELHRQVKKLQLYRSLRTN